MKNKNGIVITLIMILSSIVIYLTLTTISTKETVETIDKAKQEANKSEILSIKSALNMYIELSKIGQSGNFINIENACNNVSDIIPKIIDFDNEKYDIKCNQINEDKKLIYEFIFKNNKNNSSFTIKCTSSGCLE